MDNGEIPVPFVHCLSLQSRAIWLAAISYKYLFPNLKRTYVECVSETHKNHLGIGMFRESRLLPTY